MSEWASYMAPLVDLGDRLTDRLHDPEDPQLRHDLYRMVHSGIAAAYFGSFLGDPEHPDFWPWDGLAFNFWAPNPDNTYLLAALDGDGTYRVSGFRGSVSIVDVQLGAGTQWTSGSGTIGAAENFDLDDLRFEGPRNEFEVILSRTRPAGHDGNWWPLADQTRYIMVRQTFNDWHEEDARVAIERLDTPAIRPRRSASEIGAKLGGVAAWAENWCSDAAGWVERFRSEGLINAVQVTGLGEVHSTLKYVLGSFELAPDEALIYETEMPERCRYWNLQTTDALWISTDWVNRQISINGHQARLDADGRFRAVISATDPGVPNWLDTVGYARGGVVGRFYEASDAPSPRITKVKIAEVRTHLPADTPQVGPEERDAALRARRRAAQLRRRW